MVGLLIKQDINATSVAVAHFLMDEPKLKQYMVAAGNGTEYTEKYSPEATFAQLVKGPRWYFSLRPWIPDPNSDHLFVPLWQISYQLMQINQDAPIVLNPYLSGVKLDPATENSYVPILEKMIFPVMWLWVTAVP